MNELQQFYLCMTFFAGVLCGVFFMVLAEKISQIVGEKFFDEFKSVIIKYIY